MKIERERSSDKLLQRPEKPTLPAGDGYPSITILTLPYRGYLYITILTPPYRGYPNITITPLPLRGYYFDERPSCKTTAKFFYIYVAARNLSFGHFCWAVLEKQLF